MIEAIIFDLDNCLAAADESGRHLLAPTFDAIRRANHGTLTNETLQRAFDACWGHSLDSVARKYGFSDEMLAAGWAENARAEVTVPMRGYPDLDAIRELPARLFLVTSGFRRLQESKVRALAVLSLFERVYIDAIDEPNRKGKVAIFAEILRANALEPDEVLVVGDDADSEIAAGNRLGIPTVQIQRAGIPHAANAIHHIGSLTELNGIVKEYEAGSGD
ncbi:MAG TPA: HAD-IA family hydrolase [Gemmatimonadaceae bacterium]